jgi:hypothetical protein
MEDVVDAVTGIAGIEREAVALSRLLGVPDTGFMQVAHLRAVRTGI